MEEEILRLAEELKRKINELDADSRKTVEEIIQLGKEIEELRRTLDSIRMLSRLSMR